MPHASELEEFGLEVERENHSLIDSSDSAGGGPAAFSNVRRTNNLLSTPSREQLSLLQSANIRGPSRVLRSGVLKWAPLVAALTIAVFLHLSKQSEETAFIEEYLLDGVEMCLDNDTEFIKMVRTEENCATYISNVANSSTGEATTPCDSPVGIPDDKDFQNMIKHFCQKSCGLCGTEVVEEGVGDAEIEAKVNEVKWEIEEKELGGVIEKEMEEQKVDEEDENEDQEKEIARTMEIETDRVEDTEKEQKMDQPDSEVKTGEKIDQSNTSIDKEERNEGGLGGIADSMEYDEKENERDKQNESVNEKLHNGIASVDENMHTITASAGEEKHDVGDSNNDTKHDDKSDAKNVLGVKNKTTTNDQPQRLGD